MNSLNSPFTNTTVQPQHAFFLKEGDVVQGWVIHKVSFNGYKFSLWYDNEGNLTDLEKFTGNADRAVFGRSVRIGKADRQWFAKFSSTKTGLSLAPYKHLFYGQNDPAV